METQTEMLSTNISNIYAGDWQTINENQQWEDFLDWCRKQENGPHEQLTYTRQNVSSTWIEVLYLQET